MKTARIFVLSIFGFLLAASLLAVNSSAQIKSTVVTTVRERYVTPIGLPRPVPKTTMRTASLDFTVNETDTNWQDVSDGTEHSFLVNVRNVTAAPISIYFSRSQHLPTGWISSVCWGLNCYSFLVDSMPYTVQPNTSALLTLDLTPALDDEPDSSIVWLRIGVVGGAASDTVLLPFYATYNPPDPPLVFQWGGNPTFNQTDQGTGPWTFTDYLENHAGRGIDFLLSLQDSLPIGWSLTFDDQRNPNGINTEDTTLGLVAPVGSDSLTTNFSAYFDTTYQQPFTFTLNAPAVSAEDSAVVYLNVHPQTSNPADSASYRFVMRVQPQSSVANASTERAGIAVTNAWPNPLYSSGVLHLEILTDAAGPAKVFIYDVSGVQKGMIDLGMLREGTNELQVNAPSLPSGGYIFRVKQGNAASEVVRINYVK